MTISASFNAVWSSYETETVTLQTRDLDGTVTNDAAVTALPRATSKPIDGGLATAAQMLTWHLKASTCTSVPRRGDRIVQSDNTAWIAAAIRIESRASRYRVDTVKEQT